MMRDSCCVPHNANDLENTFNQKRTESEARAYLEKGADKRIQKLLAYFEGQSVKPFTVLDIGSGVGGAHLELLKNGLAENVVGVDASSSYIETAKRIAESLHFADRVRYNQSDFAQSPDSIPPADIVILDRVICCYPYLENLLTPAAERSKRYLALSYPREVWWLLTLYKIMNSIRRLRKSEFFTYIHPHADVYRIILQNGLLPVYASRSGEWQITTLNGKRITPNNLLNKEMTTTIPRWMGVFSVVLTKT